ncbi:MAG: radical SAM protein [Planctomycetota bacterium]
MAKILFVYPPTADPTGPYLSIPCLKAAVEERGHDATVLDLNLAGYLDLLTGERLREIAGDCRKRLASLPVTGLAWPQAAEYLALSVAVHDADGVASEIDGAVRGLRDPEQFHDSDRYQRISTLLERALALISARHFPLELSFTRYDAPFSLNTAEEIERASGPDANPFFRSYQTRLVPAVHSASPDVVGISAVFNAQLQQAFSVGRLLRKCFPRIHVTLGGAAVTQLALRADCDALRSLNAFADSLVLFEGESSLPELLDLIDRGESSRSPDNVIRLDSDPREFVPRPNFLDLDVLPAPDYGGLPLEGYLSPEPILYVAPTRGCFRARCAFCHYGLADTGTAPYRKRDAKLVVEDISRLQQRHGARFFYFAGDLIDPRYLLDLAEEILAAKLQIRFTSDLRIERSFGEEECRRLRAAGMVAAAFGTESDSPRLLGLVDKGTRPSLNRTVFRQFAEAGIAVQAMTILDFPTETAAEAHATLDLIEDCRDTIDLFFMEEFDLEAGSRVFRDPTRYGLTEVYYSKGDDYRLHARHVEQQRSKSPGETRAIVRRLNRLASRYGRRPYPYAGVVSVAHTLLYFDQHGRHVFKQAARTRPSRTPNGEPDLDLDSTRPALTDDLSLCDWPYDLHELAEHVASVAGDLERRRHEELRDVSRATYEVLSSGVPKVLPRESYYLLPKVGPPLSIPCWLWMLISCFDGETSLREAANLVSVPPREAAAAVQALMQRGLLVVS